MDRKAYDREVGNDSLLILRKLFKSFYFLFPFLCITVVWELLVYIGVFSASLIPSPSKITLALFEKTVPHPILLTHLWKSLYRVLLGFGLGAFLGISVGILMGIREIFYKAFFPILSFLISIPTLAWVPLLLVTFGIGDETVILAIFLGSFFPIVYNTVNGIRGVKKQQIWASRTMGANNVIVFFDVLLPGSMVSMIAGLRLAIGYSWRALVGAEMLAAGISWGVGHMVYAARAFNDVQTMFVGLVIIAIGGFLMDHVIMDPLERKTIEKWGMVKER